MVGLSLRHPAFVFMLVGSGLAIGCLDILGIGEVVLDPPQGSSGGNGTTTTGGDGGTGGSGGMGGGPDIPGECAFENEICRQFDNGQCLALTDNSDKDKYGFRVQQVTIWKPDAFSSGLEYTAIFQALTMNLSECNLQGGGTINMLVEYDEINNIARIGAAKPVMDPFAGYTFVDELVPSPPGSMNFFNIAPAILSGTIDADGNVTTEEVDSIVLPLYLNDDATDYILVPIKKARLYDTKVSADRNCVGEHNDHGLSKDNGCLPDPFNDQKPWIEGGKLEGYILLEEADDVIVTTFGLNRSLCVILAQDVGEFGMGSNPSTCAYLNGNIKFPGDWCSATNSGATPSCHDAVYFGLAFAASAVEILDPP